MESRSLTNTPRQMAITLLGFLVAIVVLESGGLVIWADRLDVGPMRTASGSIALEFNQRLISVGVPPLRTDVLTALNQIGWSDDPTMSAVAIAKIPEPSLESTDCSPTETVRDNNPQSIKLLSSADLSEPPLVTPLPPALQMITASPLHIALVGDSMMAVGLSNMLLRKAAKLTGVEMIKAFRSGTGLSRPDVFDWQSGYSGLIGKNSPDVVIVAIGANDAQGFVYQGEVLPYGSEKWVQVYQQRVKDFMDRISEGGRSVIWVGLPPMKLPLFNRKIKLINSITYGVVSQYPHATWWNPQSHIGDSDGQFREVGIGQDGEMHRLRSADGIHLSDEGAGLLTDELLAWIVPREGNQPKRMP